MPTLGWIQETAIDRYLERGGLDHTCDPAPVVYTCPYCNSQCESKTELSLHISISHPIERPLLLINGQHALSEQSILNPLKHEEIETIHAQELRMAKNNGQKIECSLEELKDELTSNKTGYFEVELLNGRPGQELTVKSRYLFRISIPDEQSLAKIDEHFIRHLAVDGVTMGDVRRFADNCSLMEDALQYTDALAGYVTAVLVKDQRRGTGATLPLAKYKPKMQRSLFLLQGSGRPIARVICASVRFNLNDFGRDIPTSGSVVLDAANEFFSSIAQQRSQASGHGSTGKPIEIQRPICPIDNDSFEILELFRLICACGADAAHKNRVFEAAARRSLVETDFSKLAALAAYFSLQLGESEPARTILENISNDPVFGDWAQFHLEKAK